MKISSICLCLYKTQMWNPTVSRWNKPVNKVRTKKFIWTCSYALKIHPENLPIFTSESMMSNWYRIHQILNEYTAIKQYVFWKKRSSLRPFPSICHSQFCEISWASFSYMFLTNKFSLFSGSGIFGLQCLRELPVLTRDLSPQH